MQERKKVSYFSIKSRFKYNIKQVQKCILEIFTYLNAESDTKVECVLVLP